MESVVLEDILTSNEQATKLLNDHLCTNGWCFLSFKTPPPNINDIKDRTSRFLSYGWDENRKSFRLAHGFGYYENNAKRGFRVLTGKVMDDKLPASFDRLLPELCKYFDETCTKIVECAESIFGMSVRDMANKVPLFDTSSRTRVAGCGMLDIVLYSNEPVAKAEDANAVVFEHADPGLFSISFVSTEPGLSMYDKGKQEWVPVPPNTAVIWCGSAAEEITGGKLKVGWHKVDVNKNNKQRLAMWYEVCTFEQIPQPVQENGLGTAVQTTPHVKHDIKITLKQLTGKATEFTVSSDMSGEDVKYEIEKFTGIPGPKQRLMMKGGRLLTDDMRLYQLGVKEGDIVYHVLALRGGVP